MRLRTARLATAAALLVLLAGCVSTPAPVEEEEAPPAGSVSGSLTVYAAASLQAAFDEIIAEFAAENPGVEPVAVYDGSSTLATQIIEGAPVDVFASADESTMALLADEGLLASEPELFAANELRIVTPAGNPAGVGALGDLARDDVAVVLCAPAVPCGAAAATLLDGLGVVPVSEEQNVSAVLAKIVAGEADAGLVYATDAAGAAETVVSLTPEGAGEVINSYPIATVEGAPGAAGGAFAEFVLGPRGQATLAGYGFLRP